MNTNSHTFRHFSKWYPCLCISYAYSLSSQRALGKRLDTEVMPSSLPLFSLKWLCLSPPFLTPSTVQFHMAHVLELQGCSSRARSKYEVLLGCRTLSQHVKALTQKQLGMLNTHVNVRVCMYVQGTHVYIQHQQHVHRHTVSDHFVSLHPHTSTKPKTIYHYTHSTLALYCSEYKPGTTSLENKHKHRKRSQLPTSNPVLYLFQWICMYVYTVYCMTTICICMYILVLSYRMVVAQVS